VNEKKKKLRELLEAARAIAKLAEDEKRDFSAEERTKLTELLTQAKALKEEIQQGEKDAELVDFIKEFSAEFEKKEQPPTPAGPGGTVGERFVKSPVFKAWLNQIAPAGYVPDSLRGINSPPVEFRSFFAERKELITGLDDTSAGAFVRTDITGIYEPLGRYALNVFALISRGQTTSDLVEFVRQTQQITVATPTPEANVTTYSGATGEISGEKPEGRMGFEKVTAPVKTIPAWIPATNRALADAPVIRGLIDQSLRQDLDEELEWQIVNGNGVGENFTGILNTAGILLQAFDTDILTTTRRAITLLEVTGRSTPTAFLFHPQDWETIDLLQDLNGRYYWGGPMAQGRRTLWGVPVVTSQTLTQGNCLLGDWRKAMLWDRERATIRVSDSHADFFIRNLLAILAELRAAFGVIRPSAFVTIDLEAGS
jgi:HK97 family phage major capsid protein